MIPLWIKAQNWRLFLKFGLVSAREAYHAIREGNGPNDTLLSQLYWREFYYHLTYHKPELLEGQIGLENQPLRQRMKTVKWREAGGPHWEAWCKGNTGNPFVDAGMRQMLQTGEMHNRVRMIVAMYLTKNLLIHWKHGERILAKNLIDYDPCQNSGGWQFSASVGTDTQPYRIFNIWTQLKRFDPQCHYVKTWIPEIQSIPAKDLMEWEKNWRRYPDKYIKPIVPHTETAREAKSMLKQEI